MPKFLVPVDGSESALRALQYVISLVEAGTDVSVHLVHAHEEPWLYGEIAVYVPRERIEALQRENSEAILAPAERMLRAADVPFTREILVGPIAPEIVGRADQVGCDAIVMGTRGMTALGNLLMGSVATQVVHLSPLPVTLVK